MSQPTKPSVYRVAAHGSVLTLQNPIDNDLPLYIHSLNQEDQGETHTHDFIELVCVRSGSGLHRHGSHRYPIFAGDFFVIAPGEHHAYEQGKGLRITNILFYPDMIAPFHAMLLQCPGFIRFFSIEPLFRTETLFRYKLHLGPGPQKQFALLCDKAAEELSIKTPGYQPLCAALLVEMLVLLGRCFDSSLSTPAARQEFEGKEQTVAAAISFLEQNYANDVSVADVARYSYASASRLSHVFKDTTGMSLLDYLTKIRVERACDLLKNSGRTVAEIAFELGFHDPSYFGRTFKKQTGKSPLGWRQDN